MRLTTDFTGLEFDQVRSPDDHPSRTFVLYYHFTVHDNYTAVEFASFFSTKQDWLQNVSADHQRRGKISFNCQMDAAILAHHHRGSRISNPATVTINLVVLTGVSLTLFSTDARRNAKIARETPQHNKKKIIKHDFDHGITIKAKKTTRTSFYFNSTLLKRKHYYITQNNYGP